MPFVSFSTHSLQRELRVSRKNPQLAATGFQNSAENCKSWRHVNATRQRQSHTHKEAYREQVLVSVVAAALFLRLFTAGLSTLSLGSSVRMRCGVLVLKSDWPFTWPGFLSCRSRSSSTPAETTPHGVMKSISPDVKRRIFICILVFKFSSFHFSHRCRRSKMDENELLPLLRVHRDFPLGEKKTNNSSINPEEKCRNLWPE